MTAPVPEHRPDPNLRIMATTRAQTVNLPLTNAQAVELQAVLLAPVLDDLREHALELPRDFSAEWVRLADVLALLDGGQS